MMAAKKAPEKKGSPSPRPSPGAKRAEAARQARAARQEREKARAQAVAEEREKARAAREKAAAEAAARAEAASREAREAREKALAARERAAREKADKRAEAARQARAARQEREKAMAQAAAEEREKARASREKAVAQAAAKRLESPEKKDPTSECFSQAALLDKQARSEKLLLALLGISFYAVIMIPVFIFTVLPGQREARRMEGLVRQGVSLPAIPETARVPALRGELAAASAAATERVSVDFPGLEELIGLVSPAGLRLEALRTLPATGGLPSGYIFELAGDYRGVVDFVRLLERRAAGPAVSRLSLANRDRAQVARVEIRSPFPVQIPR